MSNYRTVDLRGISLFRGGACIYSAPDIHDAHAPSLRAIEVNGCAYIQRELIGADNMGGIWVFAEPLGLCEGLTRSRPDNAGIDSGEHLFPPL